jgi:DNA-binding transcriptional MerR regulator
VEETLKVGQLARRTGLTVRTLHHYDEIGLLSPSGRTPAGHRLYGAAEVRRLQQIASLRQLGLALEDIRDCLDRPEFALDAVLEMQIARIDEQMETHRRLRATLTRLRDRLASADEVGVDELTASIEATTSYARYFTSDQLQLLRQRATSIGKDRIEQVQREWTELFGAFERAMKRGMDPASDEVGALARRAAELVAEFTGGDAGVRASLTSMYESEGPRKVLGGHSVGLAPGLWEYMAEARAAMDAGG